MTRKKGDDDDGLLPRERKREKERESPLVQDFNRCAALVSTAKNKENHCVA